MFSRKGVTVSILTPRYCPLCGQRLVPDAETESTFEGEFTRCPACQVNYGACEDKEIRADLILVGYRKAERRANQ